MAEAKLIDGKAFAAGLRTRVAKGVAELATGGGAKPGLATVLVGADPASDLAVVKAYQDVAGFHLMKPAKLDAPITTAQ